MNRWAIFVNSFGDGAQHAIRLTSAFNSPRKPQSRMKRKSARHLIPRAFFSLLAAAAVWCGAILVPPRPVITSMNFEGAELIILAQVPADATVVVLEARPLASGQDWSPFTQANAVQGHASFRFPKPAENLLFRVRVEMPGDTRSSNNEELSYVCAKPQANAASQLTLHFKARIDGSDRIHLSRGGAVWEHVNWGFPASPVAINGVQWNPSEKNLFAPPGADLLIPQPYDFRSAQVEILEGRDTIVCEPSADGTTVYVNDTPAGPGPYEFKVHFSAGTPAAPRPASQAATLILIANIDGSDRVVITRTGAAWEHKCWGWPAAVSLNGLAWSPQQTPTLANDGPTQFLPAGVDFATARLISRTGRDLAVLETRKDALVLHFADNPNGQARYEVRIAFGNE
jgi:hypothetical protein